MQCNKKWRQAGVISESMTTVLFEPPTEKHADGMRLKGHGLVNDWYHLLCSAMCW